MNDTLACHHPGNIGLKEKQHAMVIGVVFGVKVYTEAFTVGFFGICDGWPVVSSHQTSVFFGNAATERMRFKVYIINLKSSLSMQTGQLELSA